MPTPQERVGGWRQRANSAIERELNKLAIRERHVEMGAEPSPTKGRTITSGDIARPINECDGGAAPDVVNAILLNNRWWEEGLDPPPTL